MVQVGDTVSHSDFGEGTVETHGRFMSSVRFQGDESVTMVDDSDLIVISRRRNPERE